MQVACSYFNIRMSSLEEQLYIFDIILRSSDSFKTVICLLLCVVFLSPFLRQITQDNAFINGTMIRVNHLNIV